MRWRLILLFASAVATAVVATEAPFDPYADGKQAYVTRCVPCHARKKVDLIPSAYSQRGLWEMINKMAPMSRLDYYAQTQLMTYLEAVRNGTAKLTVTILPPASQSLPTTSTNDFATARELYVTQCASCHAHKIEPIQPGKHSEIKLKEWVQRMGPIAKLAPAQTELVGRYLEAVRIGKAALPGAPVAKQK
jgi:mono/diheme cytochrome c family protein